MFRNYSCLGHLIPALPTIEKVNSWLQKQMEEVGLRWDDNGADVDINLLISRLIKDDSSLIDGLHHIQIVADSVRTYKHGGVCNFGIKLFDSDPNFNSLTSMTLL